MSEITSYSSATVVALPPEPLPTCDAVARTIDALADASATASAQAGFSAVDIKPVAAHHVRVIATNPAGHRLITEISTTSKGRAELVTEVIGVRDGSCHAILDAYDAATDQAGVRASRRKRSFTGGVCSTAAAREFLRGLRRPLAPKPLKPDLDSADAPSTAPPRRVPRKPIRARD